MSRYVIGDIQGHFDKFIALLERLGSVTELYLLGDLVNRGPQSLQLLRFLSQMQPSPKIILGNHDLYLMYLVYAKNPRRRQDTLDAIYNAHDKYVLCDWLRQQDWLIEDRKTQSILVHAGIAPSWDISQALKIASDLKTMLISEACFDFFDNFFSPRGNVLHEGLSTIERQLIASDYLTRIRFTRRDGSLDWRGNGELSTAPEGTYPWFAAPSRYPWHHKIIFGHWAALMGKTGFYQFQALDTGLSWGGFLTALNLDTLQRTRI